MIKVSLYNNSNVAVRAITNPGVNLAVLRDKPVTNVVIAKEKAIQVKNESDTVNTVGYVQPVNLRVNPLLSNIERLDLLQDVDASNEIDGSTLVYNLATDTYVVKYIDFKYVTGNVHGGTF